MAYSQSKLASVTVPTRSPAVWRAGFGAYLAVDVSLVVDMLPVTPCAGSGEAGIGPRPAAQPAELHARNGRALGGPGRVVLPAVRP